LSEDRFGSVERNASPPPKNEHGRSQGCSAAVGQGQAPPSMRLRVPTIGGGGADGRDPKPRLAMLPRNFFDAKISDHSRPPAVNGRRAQQFNAGPQSLESDPLFTHHTRDLSFFLIAPLIPTHPSSPTFQALHVGMVPGFLLSPGGVGREDRERG